MEWWHSDLCWQYFGFNLLFSIIVWRILAYIFLILPLLRNINFTGCKMIKEIIGLRIIAGTNDFVHHFKTSLKIGVRKKLKIIWIKNILLIKWKVWLLCCWFFSLLLKKNVFTPEVKYCSLSIDFYNNTSVCSLIHQKLSSCWISFFNLRIVSTQFTVWTYRQLWLLKYFCVLHEW